jgi:membrane protein implicated in regulation of membrane protease activity
MKIKIYEKTSEFTVWFFIVTGIIIAGIGIWSNINGFTWSSAIFLGVISIIMLYSGYNSYKKRKENKLTENIIECEKFEVIP